MNAKTLSTYRDTRISRSRSTATGTRCPGNEDEAAALLDGYLARSMADAGRAALVAAA
jgi:hypothetical protein